MSPSRSPLRRPFALKPVAGAARVLARPAYKRYGLAEGAIGESWTEIVGADWARVSSPRHLNRASRTLTVRVAGARALELAHLERQIIGRINAFAGRELVLRLKLVQGPVSPPSPRQRGEGRGEGAWHQTRRSVLVPHPHPGPLPEERGGAAAGIQSESLRSALSALGAALAERAIKTR